MAQGAALKEVATRKLRWLLSYSESFDCAEVAMEPAMLFYKTVNRKGAPRWRGSTKILGIGETGTSVNFESQALTAAGYCVREKMEEQDVSVVECNPASGTMGSTGWIPAGGFGGSPEVHGRQMAVQLRPAMTCHMASLGCKHGDHRLYLIDLYLCQILLCSRLSFRPLPLFLRSFHPLFPLLV